MSVNEIYNRFLDPGVDYRSAPFWSWNDELSPDELRRQVNDMKEHGMGGFVIHAREGLETDYMGPQWMECVHQTVDEAKKVGMNVWLYDDDRWPSGCAAGKVGALGDEYRAKGLMLHILDHPDEPIMGDLIAVFRARLQGKRLLNYERVDSLDSLSLDEGSIGLAFTLVVDRGKYPRLNYSADTDLLNPKAIRAFIDLSHEAYKREVGSQFGDTIQAVFTDEPTIKTYRGEGADRTVTWTNGFPDFFRQRRGYDIVDHLPALFFEAGDSSQIRHDYWLTTTQLFQASYSKQLGEWCESEGLAFSGHYQKWIDDLYDQIECVGAVIPQYVHQGIPGIDLIGVCIGETVTVRGCTSVAHQFGRKWAMCETNGASGWELSFEGQKWVGDWLYVQGINIRVPHLTLYTLRGCRKRDFPPSFNYNNSWWEYNKVMEDYFARLGVVLTAGKPVRDVLVIHPMTSAWALYSREDREPIRKLSWEFRSLADGVMAAHYDYDLGDELIMEEYGGWSDNCLRVNQATYKLVVIPPVITLRTSTIDLLAKYLQAGGRVISVGDPPELIDGVPSTEADRIYGHKNCLRIQSKHELTSALESCLPRRVSIRFPTADAAMEAVSHMRSGGGEAASFMYMERELGDGTRIYFIFNSDLKNSYDVTIELHGDGKVEGWDVLTGAVSYTGEGKFVSRFGPGGSKLFVVREGETSRYKEILDDLPPEDCTSIADYSWIAGPHPVAYIGPVTPFIRTDPNVLVLDSCNYRLSSESWSEKLPVWQAQLDLRTRLGMWPIHLNDLDQQRYGWCKQPHPKDGTPAEFKYHFEIGAIPSEPIYLVIEGAPWFTFTLNGEPFSNEPSGWYLDRSFHKVLLPNPQIGKNELVCHCDYRNYYEIEDCFIIGDFGVDPRTRSIVEEPTTLRFGDWTLQGYLHYAGNIIYQAVYSIPPGDPSTYYLQVGEYSAVNVTIWINDRIAGYIPCRSRNIVDITEYLAPGENRIGIEVVGSPRNMLGPLHNKERFEDHAHAGLFRTTGESWTDDYTVHPWGLFGQIKIFHKETVTG